MQWDENKALSVVNLQDLENRIATADQNVVTGKQNIYNAIVAKGELPATQSFTDLVNAILDIILGSGNAVVGDVLATKTFTNDGGVQLTGTMANYNGAVLASHGADCIDSVVVTAGNATVTFLSKFSGKIDTATKIAIVLEGLDATVIKAGVKIGDAGDTTGNDYITGTFTSDATAVAGVILAGYTGYVNGVKITGTMAYRTNTDTGGTYPTAVNNSFGDGMVYLMPPSGYYDGSVWTKSSVPNLLSANIKKNVAIGAGPYGTLLGTLIPGNVHGSQEYTTPGTYTFVVPTDVYRVFVLLVGGGGGGGGTKTGNSWFGGHGGAGGFYATAFDVTPGNSITVVVGAGGLAGAGGTASDAVNANQKGGNSSISSIIAYGGTGGYRGISGVGGAGGGYGYQGIPTASVVTGNSNIGNEAQPTPLGLAGKGGDGSDSAGSDVGGTAGSAGKVIVTW